MLYTAKCLSQMPPPFFLFESTVSFSNCLEAQEMAQFLIQLCFAALIKNHLL